MKKMKTNIALFLFMLFTVLNLQITVSAQANEINPLIYEVNLLNMTKTDLLNALKANGLKLPEYYATNTEVAETFVHKYTPLILNGDLNPNLEIFNYDQSNEMLHNLGLVLQNIGFSFREKREGLEVRYTLKDSTAIGSWNPSYLNYNCYGYAIGKTSRIQPGELSGVKYSLSMSISNIADIILKDLDAAGYWVYKTTTKPTSLPDNLFRVICIRKDTDNEDYHFMKKYGSSLDSWAHKPGSTQPLKWNYSSPNARIWTNEAIQNGTTFAPTITYESTIYYILYKGKNDPGIQPTNLSEKEIVFLYTAYMQFTQ